MAVYVIEKLQDTIMYRILLCLLKLFINNSHAFKESSEVLKLNFVSVMASVLSEFIFVNLAIYFK